MGPSMSEGGSAFAEDMAVEVRFPRSKDEERGDRANWPWLPGTIVQQCGPAVGFAEDTPALSDSDRHVIARARELAALRTTAAVCERFAGWGDDPAPAYAEAFGTARWLLEELAAIAERSGGAR